VVVCHSIELNAYWYDLIYLCCRSKMYAHQSSFLFLCTQTVSMEFSCLFSASMQVVSPESLTSEGQECAGCRRPITERFLLKAMDQFWHEDCLKCSCCDCRLGEVGSTLYTKANLLLCRRDYLRSDTTQPLRVLCFHSFIHSDFFL